MIIHALLMQTEMARNSSLTYWAFVSSILVGAFGAHYVTTGCQSDGLLLDLKTYWALSQRKFGFILLLLCNSDAITRFFLYLHHFG